MLSGSLLRPLTLFVSAISLLVACGRPAQPPPNETKAPEITRDKSTLPAPESVSNSQSSDDKDTPEAPSVAPGPAVPHAETEDAPVDAVEGVTSSSAPAPAPAPVPTSAVVAPSILAGAPAAAAPPQRPLDLPDVVEEDEKYEGLAEAEVTEVKAADTVNTDSMAVTETAASTAAKSGKLFLYCDDQRPEIVQLLKDPNQICFMPLGTKDAPVSPLAWRLPNSLVFGSSSFMVPASHAKYKSDLDNMNKGINGPFLPAAITRQRKVNLQEGGFDLYAHFDSIAVKIGDDQLGLCAPSVTQKPCRILQEKNSDGGIDFVVEFEEWGRKVLNGKRFWKMDDLDHETDQERVFYSNLADLNAQVDAEGLARFPRSDVDLVSAFEHEIYKYSEWAKLKRLDATLESAKDFVRQKPFDEVEPFRVFLPYKGASYYEEFVGDELGFVYYVKPFISTRFSSWHKERIATALHLLVNRAWFSSINEACYLKTQDFLDQRNDIANKNDLSVSHVQSASSHHALSPVGKINLPVASGTLFNGGGPQIAIVPARLNADVEGVAYWDALFLDESARKAGRDSMPILYIALNTEWLYQLDISETNNKALNKIALAISKLILQDQGLHGLTGVQAEIMDHNQACVAKKARFADSAFFDRLDEDQHKRFPSHHILYFYNKLMQLKDNQKMFHIP